MNTAQLLEIVNKVIKWNVSRFDGDFDLKLSYTLVNEELSELMSAQDNVDTLDGIGDLSFVIIGGMYKLGIYDFHIVRILKTIIDTTEEWGNNNYLHFGINMKIDDMIKDSYLSLESKIHLSYLLNTFHYHIVRRLLNSYILHHFYDIMSIICSSNNTKDIPKIKFAYGVKGGIKGLKYISPEKDLKLLATKIKKDNGTKNNRL